VRELWRAGGQAGTVYRLNFAAVAIGCHAQRVPIAAALTRDVTERYKRQSRIVLGFRCALVCER